MKRYGQDLPISGSRFDIEVPGTQNTSVDTLRHNMEAMHACLHFKTLEACNWHV
jgi:hypothetical protein